MARTTSRRAIAAATLAITSLLAACSGGGDPADPASSSPSPSPTEVSASPSPSPSASSSAEKPERPAAMEKQDAEGAAAAAEYFLSLYPYIMKTGDTAEFEALSHESCGYCKATLENEQWLRDNGGTFSGGEITTTLEQTYERDVVTGIFPLDIRIVQGPIVIVDSEGNEIDRVDRSESVARVEVGLRDGQWVIATVAQKPVG